MKIDCQKYGVHFKDLNDYIRNSLEKRIDLENCIGQRYIGAAISGKEIYINGTPGNALGAYLNGGKITVYGNAQDATGDTMNDGEIIVHGSVGDALGYAMRGGEIYVKGDSGYRTGIHIKEYAEKKPVIVVGGVFGSFLGEYMAGGIIVILNLNNCEIVGNFIGTGMHGGKIFIRSEKPLKNLPGQVSCNVASKEDLEEIKRYICKFSSVFSINCDIILNTNFYVLKQNEKNPYKKLYAAN